MPDMNMPNAKGLRIKDYLPLAKQMIMGSGRPDRPQEGAGAPEETAAMPVSRVGGNAPIGKAEIDEALNVLQKYQSGKSAFESRLLEEEEWYRLRHWDLVRNRSAQEGRDQPRPEPTSGWLFNSLNNKHADLMDNLPEPGILPREADDEADAETLSAVLPVIFERCEYEQTYDRAAWYKLRHGVSAKGVFWNQDLEDGMGDADIRFIDMLRIYWEPGITDLQHSRNLFIVDLVDEDLLEQQYPHIKGKLGGSSLKVMRYKTDDHVDDEGKAVVVDWYYKRRTEDGRTILHYCKFVDGHVLFASENEPKNYPDGFYAHGKYPVEFDVLFPIEGTCIGFGYIALMKSPQMYIDKLDQVILENAAMSAKPRFFVKDNGGVNEDDFRDWSKDLVHYTGAPDSIIPIKVEQVGGNVLNVLEMKINELKETSSNRDFSQGGTAGGVTSGAALAVLQEAGNKTSRAMIAASYHSFAQECYLVIELIRQFYDEQRTFRITGKNGKREYIRFDNRNLQGKLIPPYEGQDLQPDYKPAYRKPVFDIVVKPMKRSPYSKLQQNELAKELLGMGFFNPQLAEQSMTAIELMDFDGKEKVKERIEQGQTLMNMMLQMQQELMQLRLIVQHTYGIQAPGMEGGQTAASVSKGQGGGKGMGAAVPAAQGANQLDYGERLAKRATPDVSR